MTVIKKKCVINNYIPHKTPKYTNFNSWFYEYKNSLIDLYLIFLETVKNRYPHRDITILETDEYFNIFINDIFDSSSKYIV
jgi:hypothetical protein